MKKNIILILSTFSLCFFCGCDFSKKTEFKKDYKSNIEIFKTFFKSKPFESISSVYNEKYLPAITYPSGIEIEGYCALIYKYKVKKVDFDSVISNIKTNAKFDFTLVDSNSYFIPSYKNSNIKNRLPSLNVTNPAIPLEIELNLKKSEMFVFDHGNGNFFNKKAIDKILTSTNIDNSNFKGKGYSSGALIDYSNYNVIYWTIIW